MLPRSVHIFQHLWPKKETEEEKNGLFKATSTGIWNIHPLPLSLPPPPPPPTQQQQQSL